MKWLSRHKKFVYTIIGIVLFLLFSVALNTYLEENVPPEANTSTDSIDALVIPSNIDESILNSKETTACLAPAVAQQPTPLPSPPTRDASNQQLENYVSQVKLYKAGYVKWVNTLHASVKDCYNQNLKMTGENATLKEWK